MRILHFAVVAVWLFTIVVADESWSWGDNKKDVKPIEIVKIQKRSDVEIDEKLIENNKTIEDTQGRHLYSSDQEIYSNETSVDDVVDTILNGYGAREGRILDGNYDQVYADPGVQEALAKGDDVQARNLIKDKLCTLGLMSCDEITNGAEGKRPFYSNIYAQGGPPRPPHRQNFGQRPGPPYGQPKPVPPPGKYNGPPRKIGYESNYGKPRPSGPSSSYHGPYLDAPPPTAQDNSLSYGKPPPGAIIYGSKPPGPVYTGGDAPYNFEHIVGDKIHVEEDHHGHNSFGSHSSSFGSNSGGFSVKASQYGGNSYGPTAGASLIKPTIIQGSAVHNGLNPVGAASSLQQHVHHHFHHVDDAAAPKPQVVTVPVPVPVPTGNAISSQFSSQAVGGFSPIQSGFSASNSAGYEFQKQPQASAAFNAGFNSASHGGLITAGSTGFSGVNSGYKPTGSLYAPGSGIKPVSEGGLGNYGNQNYGQSASGVYNGNSGSFHSTNPDYYKKELQPGSQYNNLNSFSQENKYQTGSQYGGQTQYPASGAGGDIYQGFETARQQNIDCVCVPINQCPAGDRIGRKDDLILPLDPRNLGTDIEAASDDNSTISTNEKSKIAKREANPVKASSKQSDDNDDDDDDSSLDTQARLTVGSNFGNNFGNNNLPQTSFGLSKRKVLPTFGVSFGLPFTAGAYPFNAYGGGYPAANPYFGSIGPNGLSLGLLNVNPLVSLQVTKNEFGEKLVKPLVNLHVTPSEHIIHKVGSLFKAKTQEILLNAHHQHYHAHTHVPPPPEIFHPHGNFGPPNFYNGPGPSFNGPPLEHHIHHGQEFVPNFPPIQFGGNQQQQYGFQSNYPPYPPGQFENGGFGQFGGFDPYQRSYNVTNNQIRFRDDNTGSGYAENFDYGPVSGQDRLGKQINSIYTVPTPAPGNNEGGEHVNFPGQHNRLGKNINYPIDNNNYDQNRGYADNNGGQNSFFPNDRRRKRSLKDEDDKDDDEFKYIDDEINEESSGNEKLKSIEKRQSYFGGRPTAGGFKQCRGHEVCCRTPYQPQQQQQQQQQKQLGRCGTRNAHGITGRIKNPVYIDGDSEFGEYPWQVAILKKDPKESVYVCGGTIIDQLHIITAAHCVKTYQGFDLRVRLGEWDVNHDVEFYPYVERDIISVTVHPEYYAGTLDNDLAILRMDQPVDLFKSPHISPACLPDKFSDFTGARCWTTGWGKDAFGDYGKYQNILKEVDVPIIEQQQCQNQLRHTRLGYQYNLNPGFICAGGEEGKDACKGDGGGPMVCERNGIWQLVGVVSWGIGCGQVNVPGVYVRVSYYLDWINQITRY